MIASTPIPIPNSLVRVKAHYEKCKYLLDLAPSVLYHGCWPTEQDPTIFVELDPDHPMCRRDKEYIELYCKYVSIHYYEH